MNPMAVGNLLPIDVVQKMRKVDKPTTADILQTLLCRQLVPSHAIVAQRLLNVRMSREKKEVDRSRPNGCYVEAQLDSPVSLESLTAIKLSIPNLLTRFSRVKKKFSSLSDFSDAVHKKYPDVTIELLGSFPSQEVQDY